MKLLRFKDFKKFESEAAVAPSAPQTTGVAMAGQSTTSGMGNVVSAQPSSTPGAAFTGDGTVGSGDIAYPGGVYQKDGATGQQYAKVKNTKDVNKKKKKKKKSKNKKKNENLSFNEDLEITLKKELIVDIIINNLELERISSYVDLPRTIYKDSEVKDILMTASDEILEKLLFLIA